MKINDVIYNADLMDILLELQSQLHLNGIPLFSNGFKDSGDNILCQCPYHKGGTERKPSFGLLKETGVGHCFTCGESHQLPEIISYCFGYNDCGVFGRQWLLKNFASIGIEDRRDIELNLSRVSNDKEEITYVSEEELDSYRYYHPYWSKRGIVSDWIIEMFDLGYDNATKSITFPVKDIDGNCLFIARRSVNTKWFNYPNGASKPIYGAYELKRLPSYPSEVVICESMLDALKVWEFGKYAVALNGLGASQQYDMLNNMPCRKFILATDMDEAGQRARKTLRKVLKGKIITEYIWDVNIAKDLNDMDLDMFNSLKEVW